MSLAGMARDAVWRATGRFVVTNPPRGTRLAFDLARDLPGFRVRTVLDVGANLGQSTAAFLAELGAGRVVAFEPVAATFARLAARFAGDRRVFPVHAAVGRAAGDGAVRVCGRDGDRSALLPALPAAAAEGADPVERVTVATLDGWCAAAGISAVDLLKIDVEGGEDGVLAGAEGLLAAGRVGLVHIEAGLAAGGPHVPLSTLSASLGRHGYRVYALYDQTPEWPTGEVVLRRVNAVFVAPALARGVPRPAAPGVA